MTLDDLRDSLRGLVDDTVSPYLWSDDELDIYLNKAQVEAADRADLLVEDGNPVYCDISTVIGQAFYEISPLITEVRSVYFNGEKVNKREISELDTSRPTWRTDTDTENIYTYYITGSRIRLVPTPAIVGAIEMIVKRIPTVINSVLDIPEKYHLDLLDWAAYLAYTKRDIDTQGDQNPVPNVQATFHENKFTKTFGPSTNAQISKKEQNYRETIVSSWV